MDSNSKRDGQLKQGVDLNIEYKITARYQFESIIESLKIAVTKGELIKLFERGIFPDYWDDFVEGFYLNNGEIFHLTCETYHGSGGEWKKINLDRDDFNSVYQKDNLYSLLNWESRIFMFSCQSTTKSFGEIYYPLSVAEVEKYFNSGVEYLNELFGFLRQGQYDSAQTTFKLKYKNSTQH